ncbi:MAG: TetR/AcrR family transcriptional regulator [Aquabacterium sp.]|uniref:TetR/AcrR family transcriptional regulator n=1 Tax=Aquabacterium sp. TaxID=1872578 RepID=UPI0027169BE8|nr:TetR/AcrR family transcriptional regulator [Aquabacterium sp.]MDO9004470.1 TetR/AcrR family transcriptional regulator [Aquabacterium sp.]
MDAKPSRREATHDRIVETAARAIRRAGYQGVGVADIMKEAGLTHGGFYAHFASRNALLVEAVERAGQDGLTNMTRHMAERQAAGASEFRALVESYLSDAHLVGAEHGCPVAALCSDIPRQAPEVRDASVLRVQGMVKLVKKTLPASAAADAAMVIASTMVGALQLARALGNNAQGKALLKANRQSLLAQHDQPD